MELIKRKDLENLAGTHSAFCISIYIPTHRAGEEVLQREDALLLKNQLADVRKKLADEGMSAAAAQTFTKPIEDLVQESSFWRRQAEGLALFLADGVWQTYVLPHRFEPINYVSNAFYLKPLLPLFANDGRFLLLALSLEKAKLYRGTPYSIREVPIDEIVPAQMEEVVGFDYEQKSLQFRSLQGAGIKAAFHGHGEGKDDRKEEIERFYRAIDKGLQTFLHNENLPMVVAGLDSQFGIYKKVNSYRHLFPEFVATHPADLDEIQLHARAWNLLEPWFDRERQEKIALFRQFQDTARTAFDIGDILPPALEGKVEALFLQNGVERWGVYDAPARKVHLEDHQKPSNVSLLNLAAVKTFLQGGKVYLMDANEMPAPGEPIAALFRY